MQDINVEWKPKSQPAADPTYTLYWICRPAGGWQLVFSGLKPQDVKEAMIMSVKKWEMIVDKLTEIISGDPSLIHESSDVYTGSDRTCGLCMMFILRACIKCPVAMKSGQRGCDGTPFEDFCLSTTYGEGLVAAKRELEYLRVIQATL